MTGEVQFGAETRHSFINRLVNRLIWWSDGWPDYQQEYGEQAPAAFLRQIAYMTSGRIAAGVAYDDLPIDATLAFLESEFGVDPTIDSLIAVSFLANIPAPEHGTIDTADRLGPKLGAELERHRAGGGIPVPTPYADFVNALAGHHEAVAEALREHLIDEDDDLLPHIFMGDLVRAAIEWLGTADGRASVVSVLAALDNAYGHDYEVDELIATGFVENLPYPNDSGAQLLTMLGPKLRAEYNLERPSYQIQDPRP